MGQFEKYPLHNSVQILHKLNNNKMKRKKETNMNTYSVLKAHTCL